MAFNGTLLSVLKTLLTRYFVLNILASAAYVASKYCNFTCRLLYAVDEECSLDWVCIPLLVILEALVRSNAVF